jgi:methyl-accepting chemotaxis protein
MNHVTLLGAEQVQQAARSISQSADRMERATSQMAEALERHTRVIQDLIMEMERWRDEP